MRAHLRQSLSKVGIEPEKWLVMVPLTLVLYGVARVPAEVEKSEVVLGTLFEGVRRWPAVPGADWPSFEPQGMSRVGKTSELRPECDSFGHRTDGLKTWITP